MAITLSVAPQYAGMWVGDSQVLTIKTNASDYSLTPSNDCVIFNKDTKTLTAQKEGSVTIEVEVMGDDNKLIKEAWDIEVYPALNLTPIAYTIEATPKPNSLWLNEGVKVNVATNAPSFRFEATGDFATFDKDTNILTGVQAGNAKIEFIVHIEDTEEELQKDLAQSQALVDLYKGYIKEPSTAPSNEALQEAKTNLPIEASKLVAAQSNIEALKNPAKVEWDANIKAREKTQLSVRPQPIELFVGNSQILQIDTDADTFTFKLSSNIAEFNPKTNELTALANGEVKAIVKAKATDKLESIVEWSININTQETQLDLEPKQLNMHVGDVENLAITTNANDFTFTIDNDCIAFDKVAKTITALKEGSSVMIIEATAPFSTEATQTLTANVIQLTTKLDVVPKENLLFVGDTSIIDITTDATDYNVEIDNDCVEFDKATRTLKAVKKGTSHIKVSATAQHKKEAIVEWDIEINQLKTKLEVKPQPNIIKINTSQVLDIITNADDYTLTIDNDFIDFDKPNKTLTAIKEGKSKITITAQALNQEATTIEWECEITTLDITNLVINNVPKSLFLNESALIEVITDAIDFECVIDNDNFVFDKDTKTLTAKKAGNSIIEFSAQAQGKAKKVVTFAIEAKQRETTILQVNNQPKQIRVEEKIELEILSEADTITITSNNNNVRLTELSKTQDASNPVLHKWQYELLGVTNGNASIKISAQVQDKLENVIAWDIEVLKKDTPALDIFGQFIDTDYNVVVIKKQEPKIKRLVSGEYFRLLIGEKIGANFDKSYVSINADTMEFVTKEFSFSNYQTTQTKILLKDNRSVDIYKNFISYVENEETQYLTRERIEKVGFNKDNKEIIINGTILVELGSFTKMKQVQKYLGILGVYETRY